MGVKVMVVGIFMVACGHEVPGEDDVDSLSAAHTTDMRGEPAWVLTAGSVGMVSTLGDRAAGAYVSGTFGGAYSLGGFSGTNRFPGGDFPQAFLAHVDPFGQVDWLREYQADDGAHLRLEDLDASGNLLAVVETRSRSIDLGCGEAITEASARHVIVVKLDAEGGCIWNRDFPSVDHYFNEVVVDVASDGDAIVIGGRWIGTLRLDATHTYTTWEYPSQLNMEIFLARLTSDNQVVWAKHWAAQRDEACVDYCLDQVLAEVGVDGNGNIVFIGELARPLDFGGGEVSPDDGHGFVVKLRRSGKFVLSRQFAAEPMKLAVADGGSFAVAGIFSGGTVDFGNTSVSSTGTTRDTFVVKYRWDGTDAWSRHFHGSADPIVPEALAIDHHGHVGSTGVFLDGSLNIGANRWTTQNIHGWMTVLGANTGTTLWARACGEDATSSCQPMGASFTTNARFMVAGVYSGKVDLGGGLLPAEGRGFLARFYP